VDEFEKALADYCGAPYAIAVDSCTNALALCFMRMHPLIEREGIYLPKYTYVGVVQAARNAGFMVDFHDQEWDGEYMIAGTGIVDAARWLRANMYQAGTLTCLSFQATKHLPIGRGGAILCDDEDEAKWFKRARFDGRDQHSDVFEQQGFGWGLHCYMTPPEAARGLWLLQSLPKDNKPLPGIYPDLSKKEWR
jgi:dTDP-4-amino-4,6-dideoxygalactose transaminase